MKNPLTAAHKTITDMTLSNNVASEKLINIRPVNTQNMAIFKKSMATSTGRRKLILSCNSRKIRDARNPAPAIKQRIEKNRMETNSCLKYLTK